MLGLDFSKHTVFDPEWHVAILAQATTWAPRSFHRTHPPWKDGWTCRNNFSTCRPGETLLRRTRGNATDEACLQPSRLPSRSGCVLRQLSPSGTLRRCVLRQPSPRQPSCSHPLLAEATRAPFLAFATSGVVPSPCATPYCGNGLPSGFGATLCDGKGLRGTQRLG